MLQGPGIEFPRHEGCVWLYAPWLSSAGTTNSCSCGVWRRRRHSQKRLGKWRGCQTKSSPAMSEPRFPVTSREPRSRAELSVNPLPKNSEVRRPPLSTRACQSSAPGHIGLLRSQVLQLPDFKSLPTCRAVSAALCGPIDCL